ncbi:hypothetical protein IPZ68_02355 [Streptomyces arenae]|nr:hypothetical protein [Streptomyces arenae]
MPASAADGTEAGGPSVSSDGRYAAHKGWGDARAKLDLRDGHEVTVGHGSATAGALAAKGVVHSSEDTDIVPDDTNGDSDVFVRHVP